MENTKTTSTNIESAAERFRARLAENRKNLDKTQKEIEEIGNRVMSDFYSTKKEIENKY